MARTVYLDLAIKDILYQFPDRRTTDQNTAATGYSVEAKHMCQWSCKKGFNSYKMSSSQISHTCPFQASMMSIQATALQTRKPEYYPVNLTILYQVATFLC